MERGRFLTQQDRNINSQVAPRWSREWLSSRAMQVWMKIPQGLPLNLSPQSKASIFLHPQGNPQDGGQKYHCFLRLSSEHLLVVLNPDPSAVSQTVRAEETSWQPEHPSWELHPRPRHALLYTLLQQAAPQMHTALRHAPLASPGQPWPALPSPAQPCPALPRLAQTCLARRLLSMMIAY